MQLNAKWGVCIPSGCSAEEAANNYNILYEAFDLHVDVLSCETEDSQEDLGDFDAASYIAM